MFYSLRLSQICLWFLEQVLLRDGLSSILLNIKLLISIWELVHIIEEVPVTFGRLMMDILTWLELQYIYLEKV